jgi:predicted RNA methylase
MNFGIWLTVAMVLLVCGTGTLILGLNYLLARDSLRAQIDSTALSIAMTAASLMDGDLHQKIDSQTLVIHFHLDS